MKYKQSILLFLWMIFFSLSIGYTSEPTWHFTSNDVNALHSKPADIRIAYGKEPLQFADLRLPKSPGPHPVVVIIHGGCWLSSFPDLQNTSALADALRDLGFATWNIEYRRVDNAGGGWPGTFNDVANAVDYLRHIHQTYSLDLNKVVVIGHSAGGHLALWLAGRHKLPATSPLYMKEPLVLQGIISLGGVPDLKTSRTYAKQICQSDVIGKLLGGNDAIIEKFYKDTSPIEQLPVGIKEILIYGMDDQIVPISLGKAYIQKAKATGDLAKLIRIKYAAHHEYTVPNSVAWPAIVSAIHSCLMNKTN